MGRRVGKQKNETAGVSGVNESNTKKQSKASLLKLQHLQNLAMWHSKDAAIPSLAAFFGRRFAACGEAIGASSDDSLFTCERCETILYPGDNCTVRIEKNKARKCNKHKGSKVPTQNNVVYKCHFCSHQTVKRGTLNGHMKRICPPKDKPSPKPNVKISVLAKSDDTESCTRDSSCTSLAFENLVTEPCRGDSDNTSSAVEVAILENVESESIPDTPAPVTPPVGTSRSLLDTKKRIRNKSGSKKEPEINSAQTDVKGIISSSKKRKRKAWTSLKDIVKSSQSPSSKNLPDITIPFFL